jgi:hypothetical protein
VIEIRSNKLDSKKLDREKSRAKNLDSDPLYSILSRFAKFFIKPLFSKLTMPREIEIIDDKHNKNK